MNTITEEKQTFDVTYPYMYKVMGLSKYTDSSLMKEMFSNTIWERGGLARFHSCIGFLRGMVAAGKIDEAEKLAETLFRSFALGMNGDQVDTCSLNQERQLMNPAKPYWPHGNKLVVMDDGSFLSFSFLYVGIMLDQTLKSDRVWEFPARNEWDTKYKYGKVFNGGIIFHGLDQNYTCKIGGGNGWSMNT